MKKASKKTTTKKSAKKKPLSFDDVVDSAPAPVAPVSQANSRVLVELEKAVGAVPGSIFGLDPAFDGNDQNAVAEFEVAGGSLTFCQLGTEPRDEDEEWLPVEPTEHAWGLKATQEPSFGLAATLPQQEPETQPQDHYDDRNEKLEKLSVEVEEMNTRMLVGFPPFNRDKVDLPVVSPVLSETIEVFSSLMEAFQWLYRRTKKKVRLLPEDDGKLHHRWGKAEAHMNKLKKLQ